MNKHQKVLRKLNKVTFFQQLKGLFCYLVGKPKCLQEHRFYVFDDDKLVMETNWIRAVDDYIVKHENHPIRVVVGYTVETDKNGITNATRWYNETPLSIFGITLNK